MLSFPLMSAAGRANELDGREWTRCSLSVWADIRLTAEERRLGHPAMFPATLVERLIRCFMREADRFILDPFLGSGSTLAAARNQGKVGAGFEVCEKFIRAARQRAGGDFQIIRADARHLGEYVAAGSVDFCVTSPPYWNILQQKRTADHKRTRHYGAAENDLGKIAEYGQFLDELGKVFAAVYTALRPGKYCVVNVMDLRKASRFYPLHADLAVRMQALGYVFDDLIIWDRRMEYNNLRPLGYPHVFRINKVHEYLLIFQKPLPAAHRRARQP